MIDWENITKSDCILCILRDKETKKANRFDRIAHKREEVDKRVKEINGTREDEYYEICDDEDLRTLLPLPLSQRQCNLNDIFQELRDIDKQLEYGEYDIRHTRSVIEDRNENLDKYIHTYAKDGE